MNGKDLTDSPQFLLRSQDFVPAYLRLPEGQLQRRVEEATSGLTPCRLCPRRCDADRLAGKVGVCRIGRCARVTSFFPHHGEEDCLRGWNGSGTIFLSGCSLRCVFCQNFEISHFAAGPECDADRLAGMMLELQEAGCHNINWVTPEHVVAQLLESLPPAIRRGLRLPIVYNTSGYDSLESLRLLDGIVDIYMPDFKIWDPAPARKYLLAADYPQVAREAIREMHRQVGDLRFDESGLARRGLLIRHLVMPGDTAGTGEIMRFLAQDVSLHTYINLMAQYAPAGRVSSERHGEIHCRITAGEYAHAFALAREAGLYRFDKRPER
jgi:putative pyruvate formate lyase activating enzyme